MWGGICNISLIKSRYHEIFYWLRTNFGIIISNNDDEAEIKYQ
jgi:hypothetical protein